jgi:putative transcriptional regulator
MSKNDITTVEILPNGAVIKIMPDGSRVQMQSQTDWVRISNMTEAEIEANALSDPDNLPLNEEQLKRFKRVPNPKEIRKGLRLTQEQFAIQFHVPLGTLRDWEQGAKQPDTAARSYLHVIEKFPQMVIKAFEG